MGRNTHQWHEDESNRNAENETRMLQEVDQVVSEGGIWYRDQAMKMCEAVVAANKKDIEEVRSEMSQESARKHARCG